MSTGITCTLYADGVRVADGHPLDPDDDPTALSGLEVTWGRDTTVDQPEASTLTVDVMDLPGGVVFTDLLRTGTRLDVTATGITYPDPDLPVWPDPGFEDGAATTITTNATASVTTRRPRTGTSSLELLPADAARRAAVVIAPAPFSAAGTDPGAWDEIPATTAGQPWGFGASVWVPAWASVEVRPVLFSGPYASAGTVQSGPVLSAYQAGTSPGDGAWHDLTGRFIATADGAWVGLQVTVYPTGPEWVDGADVGEAWIDGADTGASWLDGVRVFVDDVLVLAPAAGVEREVLVFSGRVTDLEATWDDETNAPLVHVNAADFTADLENVRVGDEPWTVEAMGSRFQRILDLAGSDVLAEIDDTVTGIKVSWRDVDSQGATGLLSELAASVDAIMWSATHQVTGPYLRVEDPTNRVPLYVLEEIDGLVTIVPADTVTGAVDLPACDVLRDDVTFTQNVADVATRAAVGWLEQGVDDDGQPQTTERTVTLVDAELEARFGQRGYSLSTQLQAEADASDVAGRILGRSSFTGWRASGLVIDDDELDDDYVTRDDQLDLMLALLDGTTRNGLPIRLVDLPDWTPAGAVVPVYLEGGTWTFEDGRWVLELVVSNANAQGQSGTWAQADPTWRWIDNDPTIAWEDLRGVAMPEGNPA